MASGGQAPAERPFWRIAPVVAAGVLTLAVFAGMLWLPVGVLRVVVYVAAAAVQTVLLLIRAVRLRWAGRTPDRTLLWHMFLFLWTLQAGSMYLFTGDSSAISALIDIGVGLVFAAVMVVVLRALNRPGAPPALSSVPVPRWQGYGIGVLSLGYLALAVPTWIWLDSTLLAVMSVLAGLIHLVVGVAITRRTRHHGERGTPAGE